MTPENIAHAYAEAERFMRATRAWQQVTKEKRAAYEKRKKDNPTTAHWWTSDANVEHAALHRASMDLTRALAKMRKPQS